MLGYVQVILQSVAKPFYYASYFPYFSAPALANWSALSFPWMPLWALTWTHFTSRVFTAWSSSLKSSSFFTGPPLDSFQPLRFQPDIYYLLIMSTYIYTNHVIFEYKLSKTHNFQISKQKKYLYFDWFFKRFLPAKW